VARSIPQEGCPLQGVTTVRGFFGIGTLAPNDTPVAPWTVYAFPRETRKPRKSATLRGFRWLRGPATWRSRPLSNCDPLQCGRHNEPYQRGFNVVAACAIFALLSIDLPFAFKRDRLVRSGPVFACQYLSRQSPVGQKRCVDGRFAT
jgi:hypothetical protein